MEWMNDLTWAEPRWLWALALLPLLVGLFLWAGRRRADALQRLVAARLQQRLAGNLSEGKRRTRFGLALLALVALTVALAGPRYGYTLQEAKVRGRNLIIAMDTSRSMLATDVVPSRLARAKLAAQDLILALKGDRVGLVAFAGSAFLQAPLTVDDGAVLNALEELDTRIIPRGGSNLAEAIRVSLEAFGKGEGESRVLVLFTDGEELAADVLEEARKAVGQVRIFTVGVGSSDGSLIPIPNEEDGGTEFVRDGQGNFVKSRLDEAKLREVAEITGGFYVRLQNGPAEMKRIVEEGVTLAKEVEGDARTSRMPIERYQWPLGVGIVLLMIAMVMGDRRNGRGKGASKTAAALLLFGLAIGNAQAAENAGVPNPGVAEKLAYYDRLLKQPRGDKPALHYNKGIHQSGAADYDGAVASFSQALTSRDHDLRIKAEYNLGTTLLQRAVHEKSEDKKADLTSAVEHLEEALKLRPDYPAAQKNLEVARKLLEEPPKQDEQKDDQQKDDQQKDDQQKDDQQKDDQQKDDQQKDDQQKDDQQKDDQQKDDQQKDDQQKDDQQKDDQQKDDQQKDDQQKDDQQKDDQQKDDQQKGDQQKDDQQKDDQQKGDQQKDDQQKDDQQKDDQQKDDQQKDDQQKDDQSKDDPSKGNEEQQNADRSPQPAATPEPREHSGEVKSADADEQQEQPQAAPSEPAGEEKPNEMSEAQARMLLDSLKGEDEHPFQGRQGREIPVQRDW